MDEIIEQNAGSIYTLTSVSVRVCDIGGWLDTWFAKNGEIVNLSVLSRYAFSDAPYRGIDVLVNKKPGKGIISIMAADPIFDVTVKIAELMSNNFDKRNLLLAVLSLLPLETMRESDFTIRIESPIPPGASMGTSAAISVCLIKAMSQFLPEESFDRSPGNVAHTAFRAETEVMGGQSGTQDQWAAAYGLGAQFMTINYPKTTIQPVSVSDEFKKQLEDCLITVFVGQHSSSEVHKLVIGGLESEGEGSERLKDLRTLPEQAKTALLQADIKLFGSIMVKNTEAQRKLHPGLVGRHHQEVIDLAKKCQCLGYKVNGAGGEGGSVSILFENTKDKRMFYDKAITILSEEYKYFEHKIVGSEE